LSQLRDSRTCRARSSTSRRGLPTTIRSPGSPPRSAAPRHRPSNV